MWTRSELKSKAKIAFKANYWISVLAALIIAFFTGGGSASSGRNASQDASGLDKINPLFILSIVGAILAVSLLFYIIKIVVGNALIVGAKKAFVLNETSDEKPDFKTLITVFKSGEWVNVAIVMFLRNLIIGLMTLLFIIPGIVFAYRYKMIPYILAEDPSVKWSEAKQRSIEMMNGQKWNAFVLDLSFIGWYLLSALTFGILAIFYVSPYVEQTEAELYLALKES